MSARDAVLAAIDAEDAEQFAAGAASRDAEVEGLNTSLAQVQAELLAAQNAAPIGYTEVAPGGDLQGALDKGTPVLVRGEWTRTSPLLIPASGAKIWLADDAVIWRDFDSDKGPTRSPLIGNRDWTQPSGPVSIRGTGRVQAKSGRTGNTFSLWAQTIDMFDFTTDYFADGRWFMGGAVERGEMARIAFTSDKDASSGAGGVRVATGTMWVHDMRPCVSGDDLWQVVPAGNPKDPLFNAPDAHDVLYSNLRGSRSLDGRLCVVGLQDAADDKTTRLGMKSSVHGSRFEHIDGFGGKSGFVHQNKSSTGVIAGTTTLDVVIDQAAATAGQRGEIYLNGVDATGGIDSIDLSGVTILNPRPSKQLYAQDGKVTNVTRPPQAA